MTTLAKELTKYIDNRHTADECVGFTDGFECAIEQVKKYAPKKVELPEFDKSKKDDYIYCIEWGMKKAKRNEYEAYQKMIKDLTSS